MYFTALVKRILHNLPLKYLKWCVPIVVVNKVDESQNENNIKV